MPDLLPLCGPLDCLLFSLTSLHDSQHLHGILKYTTHRSLFYLMISLLSSGQYHLRHFNSCYGPKLPFPIPFLYSSARAATSQSLNNGDSWSYHCRAWKSKVSMQAGLAHSKGRHYAGPHSLAYRLSSSSSSCS